MVNLSTIFLLYADGNLVKAFERTNFNFTTALGVGTKLSGFFSFRHEQQELGSDRAELYTADPNGPDELYTDECYSEARNLKRLDLNSTGAQIVQRSGIAKPLVVLKLFL